MNQLFAQMVCASCPRQDRGRSAKGRTNYKTVTPSGAAIRSFRSLFLLALSFLITSPLFAQISGNTSVCVGSSTTLSDPNLGGTWSSGDGSIATVSSTGVVTGVSGGVVTISYTYSSTETATVTVDAAVPGTPTISGNNFACMGSPTTLSPSVSGGTWSTVNGITSVGSSSGVVTANAIGIDTVKYTVSNSCGSSSASLYIITNGQIGNIYTYAGTGTGSFSGDNGPAYLAGINQPRDLMVDATGNVFFCDLNNNRVRKINRAGIITTVAGNGTAGNTGDGGAATAATLSGPNGVYIDNAGRIIIANTNAHAVRMVNSSGIISTIAGTGTAGFSGDGGAATGAQVSSPQGVVEDASGNIYIADQGNNRVRKIDASTGIIRTIIGNGTVSFAGDGGPGTAAQLSVRGLILDNSGNLYIADPSNNRIRKYSLATGIITTFAGNGTSGSGGNGGPATAATLSAPARFAYDGANIIYICDQNNQVVRQVNLGTGIITLSAGAGLPAGFSGDGGPATAAKFRGPVGISVDVSGNFYIADANNARIRVVTSPGSVATTVNGPSNIFAGNNLSLNSALNGAGTVSYQWYKNGSPVGSNSPTLSDAPANGDVYKLVAAITPACSSTTIYDTSNNIVATVCPTAGPLSGTSPMYTGTTATFTGNTSGGTWSSSNTSVATVGTAGDVSAIAPGTAVITYTLPASSCGTSTATYTVSVLAPDVIVASAGGNGSISPSGTLSFNGGSQTFTITANSGYHVSDVLVDGVSVGAVSSYTFSALSADHTIDASFAPNCTAPSVASAATTTSVSCNGGSSGSVTTNVTGASLSYAWSNGATTANLSGVAAGTYTYTVTNSCGSVSGSATVSEPSALVASASVTNVSCNGGSNGAVTVAATGGTGSYSGTGTFTGLSAGAFSYTVTDANGCASTAAGSVSEPSALVASASVTNVSCNGGSNGAVTVSATGGTGAYSGTGTFTGLSAGAFSYTVTDANGCTSTTSGSVAQPSAALVASSSVTNVGCYGGSTGAVNVTATGGTTPYTGTGNNTGLTAGAFSYTVTDANGCTSTTSGNITQPSAALSASSSVTNVACYGGSTGAVNVTATGGTTPYTGTGNNTGVSAGAYSYTVTDANGCTSTTSGSITQPSAALSASSSVTNVACYGGSTGAVNVTATGGTTPYSNTGSHTGLSAGSFSYTVTDAKGCTSTTSGMITQPSAALSASSSSVTNVACYGGSTGSVTVSASGGTSPYSNTGSHTGLSAGSYSFTVTDANGCTAATSGTLTQPSSGISLTWNSPFTDASNYPSCSNIVLFGFDGSISVTASGGTSPYSGTSTTISSTYSSSGYDVTVTDAHGCTATLHACVVDVRCSAGGSPDHKVQICHKGHTICVDTNAISAHLAHGDVMGSCGTFRAGNTTGSMDEDEVEAIRAYPNPNDGIFHVVIPASNKTAQIEISDITGRVVDARSIVENDGTPIQFNLGNATPGMYFIKVKAGDNSFNDKIIKR